MHKIMYITRKLFTSWLRVATRSVLFICAHFIWRVAGPCSHDTYQRVYIHMSVCKHDEIMGRVKTDVWPLLYFDFILIHVWFKQICA